MQLLVNTHMYPSEVVQSPFLSFIFISELQNQGIKHIPACAEALRREITPASSITEPRPLRVRGWAGLSEAQLGRGAN